MFPASVAVASDLHLFGLCGLGEVSMKTEVGRKARQHEVSYGLSRTMFRSSSVDER